MAQLFLGEVIVTMLIPEFELRGFRLSQNSFEKIEVAEIIEVKGTPVVTAFVDATVFAIFPKVHRLLAIRAPVFRFFDRTRMQAEKTSANLAFDLGAFFCRR